MDAQLWQKVDTLTISYSEKIDYVIEVWGLESGAKKRLATELGVTQRSISRFLSDDFPPARRREVESALGLETGWLDRDWLDLKSLKRSLAERRERAAILGVEGLRPSVQRASIDPQRSPNPISDPRALLPGVAMHVGNAVARAIHRMIERNEAWYDGKSRVELIEALHALAGEFTRRGYDTEDIEEAIRYIRRKGGSKDNGLSLET